MLQLSSCYTLTYFYKSSKNGINTNYTCLLYTSTWYIHDSCRTAGKATGNLHLLPSYDEYLIGYKDRTDVLPKEDYSKAVSYTHLDVYKRQLQ